MLPEIRGTRMDANMIFSDGKGRHRFIRSPYLACPAALLLFTSLIAGCAHEDEKVQAWVHEWETSVSAADYLVQPPDALEISSAQAPEIDGEIQTVRQDGKITLRLLGEVKVAGMTPAEIARKLESLLAQYYLDPQVSVRVSSAGSKRFYVFGQVAAPGPFPYTGRDTLLSALAQAKPTFIAAKDQIKVVRPSHEADKRHVMVVNVNDMLGKGDLEYNVMLQEGDIVVVPPTVLGWIGLRLNELLFPASSVYQTIATPDMTAETLRSFGGRQYSGPD